MAKLWGWVVAVGGFMLAALLYMAGQRDKARSMSRDAEIRAAAAEANREADRVAREAQNQAREKANETQREADKRPSGERPTGGLRRK